MRSHGKGSLSATTQVKVLSPEILLLALGQGFHGLETNIRARVTGECVSDVPGSESVAGKRTVYIGTLRLRSGQALGEPKRSNWKLPRSRRGDKEVWRFGSRTDS